MLDHPAHERVAQLAGFENVFDATVVQRRPDAGTMESRLAGTTVDLEMPLADVEVGQPMRVAIRAGDILIATEPPRGLSARNQCRAPSTRCRDKAAIVGVDVDAGVRFVVHLTPDWRSRRLVSRRRHVWLVDQDPFLPSGVRSMIAESCHELLTVRAAAQRLGVGYSTLKQWIYRGTIRTTQTAGGHHRISEAEVERLLAHHAPAARPSKRQAPEPPG